ncbi:MAG: choice-of-anchor D domain-containing protein [Candidatus Acidiferrales bacterium]
MRRLVLLGGLAVITSAMVAHSLPRGTGDATAPSGALQTDLLSSVANPPVVIATGTRARSLAVVSNEATSEDSGRPSLYLTTADQPNRLFALGLAAAAGRLQAASGAKLAPIAGVGEAGSLGDGGPALAAQLNLKLDSLLMRSGIVTTPDGTIFISDTLNATIRRVAGSGSTEPGVIRSIAGRWAPRESIELVEPMGIALDRAGNLYIADYGANEVLVMRAATAQAPGEVEMLAHVAQPTSIASTSDGSKVYVSSMGNDTVFAINTRTREIQSVVGIANQAPACTASQSPKASPAEICPTGLAVDGGGNVFIADSLANHILRVDAKTSRITIAATQLTAPGEIRFDANGNLFAADQARNRVVEFQELGQAVNAVTLLPSSNDFGVEPTGGTSPTAPFTLTNSTNAALTNLVVTSFQGADPGDFQTLSSSCTSTLAANSSCTINVAFVPIVVAGRSAQLAVTYAGAPALTADLTGAGAQYQLAVAGTQNMSVTVIAGMSATYDLQLIPDSNFPTNSPYTVTFVAPPIGSPNLSSNPPGDLPALTATTFAPTSVTVTPGTAVPFTFTIETTSRVTGLLSSVPAGLATRPPSSGHPPFFPALATLAAIAIFTALSAAISRGARRLRVGPIALLFLAVAGLIGGCGGNGKSRIIGTQPGTTSFLVQATVQNAQGASLNVARGIPLQIVVQ